MSSLITSPQAHLAPFCKASHRLPLSSPFTRGVTYSNRATRGSCLQHGQRCRICWSVWLQHPWQVQAANQATLLKQTHKLAAKSTWVDPQSDETEDESEYFEPCLGAVFFHRQASTGQSELCTTLEQLNLASLSTGESKETARNMGVKGPEGTADEGTPVDIAFEVDKQGQDLVLDGVVRTSAALSCGRCLAMVGERVYAPFQLRLVPEPVPEVTRSVVGIRLGKKGGADEGDLQDFTEDDNSTDSDIDADDRIYFPPGDREVDISKYIRDTIILELPARVLCGPDCKGVCLDCGVNLNLTPCKCGPKKGTKSKAPTDIRWQQLENLKDQLGPGSEDTR